MKILAIDTVTESCSAALLIDGDCRERTELAVNRHSQLILPMIQSLLDGAGISLGQIDVVAFDRGPGSFTGVRIGIGVAQGIAFAADLPVCGVSSLVALAAPLTHDYVLSAIDARMGEIYWALVDTRRNVPEEPVESLDNPSDVRIDRPCRTVQGVGSGWDRYAQKLERAAGEGIISWTPNCFPEARWVATIAKSKLDSGETIAAEQAAPVYLRNRVTG